MAMSLAVAWGACSVPGDTPAASEPVVQSRALAPPQIVSSACTTIKRGVAGALADGMVASGAGATGVYGTKIAAITGDVNGTTRQTLLRADLAPIPQGVTITSSTLKLTARGVQGGFTGSQGTVRMHEVYVPWTETGTTWNSFYAGSGPRFGPTLAQVVVNYVNKPDGPVQYDLTALTRGWHAGGTNHGVLLEQTTTGVNINTSFYTGETGDLAKEPALTVCFETDACHELACTGEICVRQNKANGTACSDGNACTLADTCQAGVCTAGAPRACSASDACHAVGVCNTATGVCTNPVAPDGTACDDGQVQTADHCQGGVCQGTAAHPTGAWTVSATGADAWVQYSDWPASLPQSLGANASNVAFGLAQTMLERGLSLTTDGGTLRLYPSPTDPPVDALFDAPNHAATAEFAAATFEAGPGCEVVLMAQMEVTLTTDDAASIVLTQRIVPDPVGCADFLAEVAQSLAPGGSPDPFFQTLVDAGALDAAHASSLSSIFLRFALAATRVAPDPVIIAACQGQAIFTVSPAGHPTDTAVIADKLGCVIPLGNLSRGGHVVPTAHMYFFSRRTAANNFRPQSFDVFAPADLYITRAGKSHHYDDPTDPTALSYTDYYLEFTACAEVSGYMLLLQSLTPDLEARLFPEATDGLETCESSGNYMNCARPIAPFIKLHGGDVIGTGGSAGGGTHAQIDGFDFGLRDLRTLHEVAAPELFGPSELAVVPMLDYYATTGSAGAVHATLVGLLGMNDALGGFTPVNPPGYTGSAYHDVVGTAAGAWRPVSVDGVGYENPPSFYPANSYVTLTHWNIDTTRGAMAIGTSGGAAVKDPGQGSAPSAPFGDNVFLFDVASSGGDTNVRFQDVTPGPTIYCYQGLTVGHLWSAPILTGVVLMRMPTADRIELELDPTTNVCGPSGARAFDAHVGIYGR